MRDGRDHIYDGASKSSRDYFETWGTKLGFGGESGVGGLQTWVTVNTQMKMCGEAMAAESPGGEVQYLLVRIEDFINPESRRAAVVRVLQALNLPRTEADVERGIAVFDAPIDAPADYLQTHYGRWRGLGKDDQRAWFEAVRPGLDALGYVYNPNPDADGMIGKVLPPGTPVPPSAPVPAPPPTPTSPPAPNCSLVNCTPPPAPPPSSNRFDATTITVICVFSLAIVTGMVMVFCGLTRGINPG